MARTFVVVVMQKRAVRRADVERLRQSHPTRTAAHRLQGVAQLLEQHHTIRWWREEIGK